METLSEVGHMNKGHDINNDKFNKVKYNKPTPRYFDSGNEGQKQEVYNIDDAQIKKSDNLRRKQEHKKNVKRLRGRKKKDFKGEKKFDGKETKKGFKGDQDASFYTRQDEDPFPGDRPISEEQIEKYRRGKKIKNVQTKSAFHTTVLQKSDKKLSFAAKQAARTEFLLKEDEGFLEADVGEDTSTVTQHEIADVVDITSAHKFFELKMSEFGPYRINYTRNGRFLLFGGGKGHVAAIDWMTKKLLCEVNVMETLHDVRWLHQETMFAVAQKQWTYIYDNQGVELHCLKVLDRVLKLEFLPYHFLLAAGNETGYLSYIDVSVGEKVAGYSTGMGRLGVMCQNPSNAIIALGHAPGTVSMWCPKMREPVAKMLCHKTAVRSLAIDKKGQYLATSGIDRTMRIWDLRTYKLLQSYKVEAGPGEMAFSQRGLLAASMGNIVQVYKDCCTQTVTSPYMSHRFTSPVHGLQYCPYEDVLGVGHGDGFSSLIIPGAGEANFDALEENPYQKKSQRKEAEVKMLLEKIPADMIHLDSSVIHQVDRETLNRKVEEHNAKKKLKPLQRDFQPRYKMKGKSKDGKFEQRKKGRREEMQRDLVKKDIKKTKRLKEKVRKDRPQGSGSVLDRFKPKED